MEKNVHVLAIDCQVDFTNPNGALFVRGADQDMIRAANFIRKMSDQIDTIHATLDSHQEVHIAHPVFWINSNGENPSPFTVISSDDIKNGKWFVKNENLRQWGLSYAENLEKNGKYPLRIWPPHCITGSANHALDPHFSDACREWQRKAWDTVDFQMKGSNPLTEHYSIFRAEVPVDGDISTYLNVPLMTSLREAGTTFVMGEALSHCVKFSILDLLSEIGEDYAKKFIFLEDTSSSVSTYEEDGIQFISDMKKLGMNFAKTTDF